MSPDETMRFNLKEKKVKVLFLDPWELVSAVGSGPFTALVVEDDASRKFLLLEMERPFTFVSTTCRYFVAQVRHEGIDLCELTSGGAVASNLTLVPPERVLGGSAPFSLSWWRRIDSDSGFTDRLARAECYRSNDFCEDSQQN